MNGTGTQENPYIIMTADDLYSVGEIGTEESYFILGADIDLSMSQYADRFIPIPIKCLDFDGNGHMIRNVNLNVPDGTANIFTVMNEIDNGVINIHGLVLENIRLIGDDVFIFATGNEKKCGINLEYCTFNLNEICYLKEAKNPSGVRNCLLHDTNIAVSADYCTFSANVDFTKTRPLFSGDTVSHTQIKADMSTIDFATTDDSYNAVFSGTSVSDSYFFGRMERRESNSTGSFCISSPDCLFSRFYMVFTAVSGIATAYMKGTIATTCFYDIDELKKYLPNAKVETGSTASSANARNLLGLTTEQCKSAEYLRSVNFDCLEG